MFTGMNKLLGLKLDDATKMTYFLTFKICGWQFLLPFTFTYARIRQQTTDRPVYWSPEHVVV